MTTTPILSHPPDGGVLIASPNAFLREQVLRSPRVCGRTVQETLGGAEALGELEKGDWQLLFIDRKLPDLDVEELIQIVRHRFPGTEVVVLDSENARNLPEMIGSPLTDEMNGPEFDRPCAEESTFRFCFRTSSEALPGMIGTSKAMICLYQMVRVIAPRDTTVLITGASGTGKELVASALHKLSPRASRPFVIVNCAAIPETLLESELFGHVRGAFTGAIQSHVGRIHAASGGTLFLDEIGELPLSMQAKLLRFLEQKEIQRIGGTEAIKVDVRIVAATNVDLMDRVDAGTFREDLYYRLSAFPLELPSLSERIDDVLPLARHFLNVAATNDHKQPFEISPEAVRLLRHYAWPGNVRELLHVIERAAILAEGQENIGPEHLHLRASRRAPRMEGRGQGPLM